MDASYTSDVDTSAFVNTTNFILMGNTAGFVNKSLFYMSTLPGNNLVSYLFQDEYTDLNRQTNIALYIISLVLAPITISGNLMVLISMFQFENLRTVTNMFLGSLALADFLLGLITLPLYALFYINQSVGRYKYLCLLKYCTALLSMGGSMYSLVAIAIDRYIAILHPLKYKIVMTKRLARRVISTIWIYILIVSFIPIFGWNNYDNYNGLVCDFFKILPLPYTVIPLPVSLLTCLLVTMYLYQNIFKVATKQLNKIKTRARFHSQLRSDVRSAQSNALILFFFFVFWIPFMVTAPLKYVDISDNLSEVIKNIGMTIAMSNSAIKPFIYCWLRSDFRQASYRLLCRGTSDAFIGSPQVRTISKQVQSYNVSDEEF